jgi:hypothetical protein
VLFLLPNTAKKLQADREIDIAVVLSRGKDSRARKEFSW